MSQEAFSQLFQDLFEHVYYILPDSPFRQALNLKASWTHAFERTNLPSLGDTLNVPIKEPDTDLGGSGPATVDMIPFVTSAFHHAHLIGLIVIGVSKFISRLMPIDNKCRCQ